MELTVTYILSQAFIIIYYLLIIVTYQLKNRRVILILNFLSLIVMALSFLCLNAYSGMMMAVVSIIRNIIFLYSEKRNINNKQDIIILIFIYFLSIICAIWTYKDIWSLTSVLAAMVYTYSIWQKNTKVYKILGIPVGIFSIIYNIYVFSIIGIILEIILFVSATIGYLREK